MEKGEFFEEPFDTFLLEQYLQRPAWFIDYKSIKMILKYGLF